MVEFYTVKRIDNSRLARRGAAGFMRRCGRQLTLGVVIALGLLAYTWQRYDSLELSYQLEQADQSQTRAAGLNRELKLELATLRSPARIDLLARNQLGMTVPEPGQIVLTEPQATGEMAEARTSSNPSSFR
ncbi:MAG TPA: cell division protein FtsL [Patescibacteria group bacterium]|nr:cell division protein FtsL [Patescibacteria group bacterium]